MMQGVTSSAEVDSRNHPLIGSPLNPETVTSLTRTFFIGVACSCNNGCASVSKNSLKVDRQKLSKSAAFVGATFKVSSTCLLAPTNIFHRFPFYSSGIND